MQKISWEVFSCFEKTQNHDKKLVLMRVHVDRHTILRSTSSRLLAAKTLGKGTV
jgi:hypothetical protein